MKKRLRPWLPGVFIVLSVAAIACGAGGDETIEQTFEVGASPRLMVGAGNGDVVVRIGADEQITVLSDVSSSNNVDLDVALDDDVVTVRSLTNISGNLIGDRAEGRVDLTISVPSSTVVEVGITTGAVTIAGVMAGGRITAAEGDITLRGVSGDFSGGTGTGDVTISGSGGSFRFTIGVGAILFEGELASGGSNEFETGIGDVTVIVPADAGVQIDATVSSGSVTSDLDIAGESRDALNPGERFSGRFGDGGAKLTITVGTGSIQILAASGKSGP